jgi:hypothetical protein
LLLKIGDGAVEQKGETLNHPARSTAFGGSCIRQLANWFNPSMSKRCAAPDGLVLAQNLVHPLSALPSFADTWRVRALFALLALPSDMSTLRERAPRRKAILSPLPGGVTPKVRDRERHAHQIHFRKRK